jgi:hypothetical protein
MVVNYKNKLERLGYKSNDPIRQASTFTEAIKGFQKTYGLFVDGRLSKETRAEIDKLWDEVAKYLYELLTFLRKRKILNLLCLRLLLHE